MIEAIIKENVKFRLQWGGEYLDFRLNEPKDYIIPEKGSVSLLNSSKLIVPYTIKSFINLSKGASKFMVFGATLSKNISAIFDCIGLVSYKDWSRMISDLEKEGKVITVKSLNVLSESGLRFSFKDSANIKVFGPSLYEFDSLGTTMFVELGDAIETLWKTVKDAQEKS